MYDEERPYTVIDDKPGEREREGYWAVAASLQKCDGLEVSDYAEKVGRRYVVGEIDSAEAEKEMRKEYEGKEKGNRQAEADIVSARIVTLLESSSFVLSLGTLKGIHATLFEGVLRDDWVGVFRRENISKEEPVLGGRSVQYADWHMLKPNIDYDFEQEKAYRYSWGFDSKDVAHFASFISNVWQTHPFREGNTRTTAVFSELYLRSMGFDVSNDRFAENATYFRDSLVRASYSSIREGIKEDHSFIEAFYCALLNDKPFDAGPLDLNIHGIRATDTPYREPFAKGPAIGVSMSNPVRRKAR